MTDLSSKAIGISGILLAGGLARRMNHAEKGLIEFAGKPMIQHVLERLRPQVDEVLINANREIERYAAFGHAVIPDRIQGHAGPLAGLHSGMHAAKHALVMTVPCDSPFLPKDLAVRLAQNLTASTADIAIAKTGSQNHPVFCLCRRTLYPHLENFMLNGGRKFEAWCNTLATVEVAFDDNPKAFVNINTLAELKLLQV